MSGFAEYRNAGAVLGQSVPAMIKVACLHFDGAGQATGHAFKYVPLTIAMVS